MYILSFNIYSFHHCRICYSMGMAYTVPYPQSFFLSYFPFLLRCLLENFQFFLYFCHFQSVSLWVMKYTCICYYYKWWDSYSLHHQHGEHTQLSMVTSRQCSADDLVMSNKGLSINLFPLWIISFLHFIIFTNFVHFVVAFFVMMICVFHVYF